MKGWKLQLRRIAKILLIVGGAILVVGITAVTYMVWPRRYARPYLELTNERLSLKLLRDSAQ